MIVPLTSAATIAVPAPDHRPDGVCVYQLTPASALQLNWTPDGLPGQQYVFKIVTSGVSSYVVTFGTNFIKTGTLATGTTTAQTFSVSFYSDGQNLIEQCRTAAAA